MKNSRTTYCVMESLNESDSILFDIATDYEYKYKWVALMKMKHLNKINKTHKYYVTKCVSGK